MNNNNNSSGGLGVSGVLLIVFIVLKLIGVINWSWWWVLSPLWISILIVLFLIAGVMILAAHDEKQIRRRKDKWRF